MQVQTDGSSVINHFEGSFTEEGTGSGKAIFGGGFKFADFEARKDFDSTYLLELGVIGVQSGRNWGVIKERLINRLLSIYKK